MVLISSDPSQILLSDILVYKVSTNNLRKEVRINNFLILPTVCMKLIFFQQIGGTCNSNPTITSLNCH